MTADETISVEEFFEAIMRVEELRDKLPSRVDLTNDELIDEVIRLGIVTEPALRALAALAGAFGVADERPSVAYCISMAKLFGARPECVAARWGYLPTAMIGGTPWLDVEVPTDDYALIRWDDAELTACLFIYRVLGGVAGGRLGCRVSLGYRQH